jgi:hypothetical protein
MTNKDLSKFNDEINLLKLIKIIWIGRLKIFLITVATVLIAFFFNVYNSKEPDLFKNSLIIRGVENSELYDFLPLSKYFNEINDAYENERDNKLIEIDSVSMLNKFKNELLDYEELIFIFKDNENIKKEISQLSKYDAQQKLYSYTKLLNIEELKNKVGDRDQAYSIELSLYWNNSEEASVIINQAIRLTLENLKKDIFDKLDKLYNVQSQILFSKDLNKIDYLSDQSSIAKELGLEDIYPDNNFLPQSKFSLYYLRGSKSIEKEIELIKNRKYSELSYIKKKIDNLKKIDFKWIDYNLDNLSTQEIKNYKSISLKLSFILGLIIGAIYVFLSDALQPRKD